MAETRDKTILIVDDEEENLQFFEFAVTKEGFNVKLAGNGTDAVHLIEHNSFDLVILDMRLPGRSGFEIIKLLQSYEYRDIPIIAITGRFERNAMAQWMQFEPNVAEYIIKPVNTDYLLYKIHSLLDTVSPQIKQLIDRRTNQEEADEYNKDFFPGQVKEPDTQRVRRHYRMPADLLVSLYVAETLESRGSGFIEDISLGGFSIKTDADFEVGTEVFVKTNIAKPSSDFFGAIVRREKLPNNLNRFGAQFTRMVLLERVKLKKKIEKHVKGMDDF